MIDARTDGRTHRQTQATTIPEGQNWPRVKKSSTGKPAFESPTVMSVERSATKGQSPRLQQCMLFLIRSGFLGLKHRTIDENSVDCVRGSIDCRSAAL